MRPLEFIAWRKPSSCSNTRGNRQRYVVLDLPFSSFGKPSSPAPAASVIRLSCFLSHLHLVHALGQQPLLFFSRYPHATTSRHYIPRPSLTARPSSFSRYPGLCYDIMYTTGTIRYVFMGDKIEYLSDLLSCIDHNILPLYHCPFSMSNKSRVSLLIFRQIAFVKLPSYRLSQS